MERGKDKASAAAVAGEPAEQSGGAGEYAKVMTDEQVEVLRKQISIYATLCDQLLEAHRARIAHQEYIAGVRLGSNPYRDRPPTAVHGGGRKTTGRQRWAPTPMQLQILETIFGQGNGVLPGRQKVQDITAELSRHGQVVAETSVYNWFQNRRARVKRNLKLKQAASMPDRT